jgi:hypothetical protein
LPLNFRKQSGRENYRERQRHTDRQTERDSERQKERERELRIKSRATLVCPTSKICKCKLLKCEKESRRKFLLLF